MDSIFLIIFFLIIFIITFCYIRIIVKSTICSAAIMSLVIALIFIWLIEQAIPCNHRDNREGTEGLIILSFVVLVFSIIYIFYMGLNDKDICAIEACDRNIVFW